MTPYGKIGFCLLAVALAGSGCGSPPPPVPPKPKPAPKPKPKPPPPPQCESLDEGCQASGDTKAKIALSKHVFTPPEGWEYAQGPRATIAQVDAEGPVLVLTSFTPESDKKALQEQRTKALTTLAKLAEIELPDKKVDFDRPQEHAEVAGLQMQYWQLEKASRGEKTGSLLVLLAGLADERSLLGLGYVPDADTTEADRAIFKCLESIKLGDDSSDGESEEAEEADQASRAKSGAKESST